MKPAPVWLILRLLTGRTMGVHRVLAGFGLRKRAQSTFLRINFVPLASFGTRSLGEMHTESLQRLGQ
jgi:hypothetical protein